MEEAEPLAMRQKKRRGPPSKCTPEAIERGWAYVEGGYTTAGQAVPTVAGLARALGVTRKTVYEWAKDKPEISDMLEVCKAEQEILLVNKGLLSEFNSNICKLMLAKHGYGDKSADDEYLPQITGVTIKVVDASVKH